MTIYIETLRDSPDTWMAVAESDDETFMASTVGGHKSEKDAIDMLIHQCRCTLRTWRSSRKAM